MVKNILRFESLLIFIISIYFYSITDGTWHFFLIGIFLPDISMIGYFVNKRLGTITYNLVHNYLLSVILIFVGFFSSTTILTSNYSIFGLGIILAAHVSIDRLLGFGLKYPSSFKETHIQKV